MAREAGEKDKKKKNKGAPSSAGKKGLGYFSGGHHTRNMIRRAINHMKHVCKFAAAKTSHHHPNCIEAGRATARSNGVEMEYDREIRKMSA